MSDLKWFFDESDFAKAQRLTVELEAATARITDLESQLLAKTELATLYAASLRKVEAEVERLNAIINTPHADDFIRAVSVEAEHQRQRWGAEGDAGKTPADWFWLVGYLAGKALHAHAASNTEKGEHHIITTAAACANWHRALFGKTDMRPGHEQRLDAARLQGKEGV